MAVKNALAVKKLDPAGPGLCAVPRCPDLRLPGNLLPAAREAGVVFIRYTRKRRRRSLTATGWSSRSTSPDFPEPLAIEADHVVLSTGVEADLKKNKRLSDMLKVRAQRRRFLR